MGTWGSSLYSNDTTSDIKILYTEYLKQGKSNQEAYDEIMSYGKEYMEDEDEAPLFWYALADTQWSLGRLMPEVKESALQWIAQGGGLKLWEESKKGSVGWAKTLEKLKEKLLSEMPPEKKFRKPAQFEHNPWEIGDVYAYQFHTDIAEERGLNGKYILFRKVDNYNMYLEQVVSVVQVFDRVFDELPTVEVVDSIRVLPLVSPDIQVLKETQSAPTYKLYFNQFLKYVCFTIDARIIQKSI